LPQGISKEGKYMMKRADHGNNAIPSCQESFPHLSLPDLIGQSRKKTGLADQIGE